jgi:hypothetical protein
MANWRVSPVNKKSAEEVEIWVKDGQTIRRTTVFRGGTFYVETTDDEMPEDIDPANPDGINMNDYFSDNAENGAELESLWDGCYSDVEYPADMSEEERQRLEELWEEDSYSAWEEDGWMNDETECWFYGPLEIEKVD